MKRAKKKEKDTYVNNNIEKKIPFEIINVSFFFFSYINKIAQLHFELIFKI